MYMTKS